MEVWVALLIIVLPMTWLVIRVIAYARALFPCKRDKCKDK